MTVPSVHEMPGTETWSGTLEFPYTGDPARAVRTWVRTVLVVRFWGGDVQTAAVAVGWMVEHSVALQHLGGDWACRPLALRLTIGVDGDLLVEVSSAGVEFPGFEAAKAVMPSLTWSMHEDVTGKTVQARLPGGGAG
ncbi:hypothetical protein [Streptomyces sp. NPDC048442]|uniref:hypothetical protein n=1 Tax=Streptomyces sp. NPDC048442 TaxID=3154823 RepID=UPI00343C8B94